MMHYNDFINWLADKHCADWRDDTNGSHVAWGQPPENVCATAGTIYGLLPYQVYQDFWGALKVRHGNPLLGIAGILSCGGADVEKDESIASQ